MVRIQYADPLVESDNKHLYLNACTFEVFEIILRREKYMIQHPQVQILLQVIFLGMKQYLTVNYQIRNHVRQ